MLSSLVICWTNAYVYCGIMSPHLKSIRRVHVNTLQTALIHHYNTVFRKTLNVIISSRNQGSCNSFYEPVDIRTSGALRISASNGSVITRSARSSASQQLTVINYYLSSNRPGSKQPLIIVGISISLQEVSNYVQGAILQLTCYRAAVNNNRSWAIILMSNSPLIN